MELDTLDRNEDENIECIDAPSRKSQATPLDEGMLCSMTALLYLPCELQNKRITALLDSGACNNFISLQLVKELGLPSRQLRQAFTVKSASGTHITVASYVRVKLCFNGLSLRMALRVAAMSPPLILGMPFLQAYNPVIDWRNSTVELSLRGKRHKLTALNCREKPITMLDASAATDFKESSGEEEEPQVTKLSVNSTANANDCASPELSRMSELENEDQLFLCWLTPVENDKVTQPLNSMKLDNKCYPLEEKSQESLGSLSSEIQTVLNEYSDVFQPPPPELPPDRGIAHKIRLFTGAQPPAHRIYRMSPTEELELQKQLKKYLDAGWIEKAQSPFGAGVLFAKKKDGSYRLCIDYRSLNKLTIKDKYPLPRIDESLDGMKGSVRFTKLDLTSGYHQVRVDPADIHKTAFQTKYGSYQFRVLPFGLCNAPATFQRLMNTVLEPYLNSFVKVYLDDTVIHSSSVRNHAQDLRKVLQTLRENQLFCNLKKCEFDKAEINFCGFKVSKAGIRPQMEKVKLINTWPKPTCQKDIRAFLGFCGFYRKFIPSFAKTAAPLTELLQNEVPWQWNQSEQQAFAELQKALSENALLVLPDPKLPYYLFIDASNQAIGATINQKDENGVLQLIACSSRKLSKAERNYPTQEKELLSLFYHLNHWRHYLLGAKTYVSTDSSAMTWIQTCPHPSPRQARWLAKFAEYDMEIKHIPGKLNTAADSLTRTAFEEATLAPVTNNNADGWLQDYLADPYTKAEYFDEFNEPKEPTQLRNGYYWHEDRIIVPQARSEELIKRYHDGKLAGHFGISRTEDLIARRYLIPKLHEKVKNYVAKCDICQRVKAERQKQRGYLRQLNVPARPWSSISLDWLEGLPLTARKHNSILVAIDRGTRLIHLIPTSKEATSQRTAELFLDRIVKLHGIPNTIFTDRDSRFICNFWKSFCELLDIKHNSSTAFHPTTNGLVERANQTLGQLLRATCQTKGSWDVHLPFMEIAWNNANIQDTKFTPYYLSLGYHPHFFDDEFEQSCADQPDVDAKELVTTMRQTYLEFTDLIRHRQALIQRRVDEHRRPTTFRRRQLVMVNIAKRQAKSFKISKLADRWIGPFPILQRVAPDTYRVQLPPNLSTMHPVFHVSLLKPYYGNPTSSTPTTPVPLPREEESVEEDDSSNNDDENVENYNLEPVRQLIENSEEDTFEYSEEEFIDDDDGKGEIYTFGDCTDVKLDPRIFVYVCRKLKFVPTVDVFASYEHHQLERYCTKAKDDQNALTIDGFKLNWRNERAYINPPFKLMFKVLAKLALDKAKALVVTPVWEEAKWWNIMQQMTRRSLEIEGPIYLSKLGNLRPTPPFRTQARILDGRLYKG